MDVSGIKCPDNDHSSVTNLILFGSLYIRRNQAGLMKTCKVKSHSHQSSSTYLPLPHPWGIVPISFLTGIPLPQVVIAGEGIQFSRAIYPKIIILEKLWPNYCGLKYFIMLREIKSIMQDFNNSVTRSRWPVCEVVCFHVLKLLQSKLRLWIQLPSFSKVKICVFSVTKLCLTLCDPMNCSPPDSSVYGVSQVRILKCIAISFSRGSSRTRD